MAMMKAVQSGRLIHSVVLQKQVETKNALNEKENTWEDSPNPIRCAIEQAKDDEREGATGQTGITEYLIGMYYHGDLDERSHSNAKQHRLKWGDLTLDIVSIDNIEFKNQFMLLRCRQVSRTGIQAK